MLALTALTAPIASGAEDVPTIYFGNGCFWWVEGGVLSFALFQSAARRLLTPWLAAAGLAAASLDAGGGRRTLWTRSWRWGAAQRT